MYDLTTAVIRGQGGPHIGHEALLRQALQNTNEGGSFVLFMGSAQARPEPANPFSWRERSRPFRACFRRLTKEVGKWVDIRILPLRDRVTNLQWANSLFSRLVEIAQETEADISKMAIVDAQKNGAQSAYDQWFKGKLHVLSVPLISGIHATDARRRFFLEEADPLLIEGLTPEAVEFLSNWKVSSGRYRWVQSEFRFKEGFARPLTDETRVVVCAGSRILLFRRTAVGGPGYGQYDVPVEGSSFSLYGENDKFQVYYPGIADLLVDDSIRMRLVNEATGPSTVRLYDIDDDRENDFFGFQNGWHQLPAISGFDERAALLRTPLIERRYPSIINDHPQLVVPEWVEFDLFPKIEFFGRGTSLYLERVLGEIPVIDEGDRAGVGIQISFSCAS